MLRSLYPSVWVNDAYTFDYKKMYDKGYRAIIYDIDNTLVRHGYPANKKALRLFEKLRNIGFKYYFTSNNKDGRVKPFADAVKADGYICKAGKPKPGSYLRAMELMGTDKSNTFFMGDQLFTDIWGANRAGIYSVLVKPIHPKEEIQIVLKRFLEKPILLCYRIYRRFHHTE